MGRGETTGCGATGTGGGLGVTTIRGVGVGCGAIVGSGCGVTIGRGVAIGRGVGAGFGPAVADALIGGKRMIGRALMGDGLSATGCALGMLTGTCVRRAAAIMPEANAGRRTTG